MTLFFPDNGGPDNNVKIASSNSQVGLTVGDTMTITAGDTFTIGAGSTSTIKFGPATSFSLGSAVNISLASTLSYTYGFTAAYGSAVTAMSTSSKAKATDSYTIQAGVYTPVTQTLTLAEKYQTFAVILATVLSMGAIAIAVVGSLSSPMFVAPPSGSPSTASAVINPDSNAVTRSACALAITTTVVFIGQWALTYLLAKSTAFDPVTNMVFNSTGINATANTNASFTANATINAANKAAAEAYVASTAAGFIGPVVAAPPVAIPTVPSVESIMYTPPATAVGTPAMFTHRVNDTPVANLAPQLSEIILTPSTINLNTTTKAAAVPTHNTQIIMDSATQQISLLSDSAAVPNGGGIVIGKNTNISNPDGNTVLMSSAAVGSSSLNLTQATSATLTCTNNVTTGSVNLTPTQIDIGVGPAGGNIVFTSAGTTLNGTTLTLSGTTIDIGGAITVIGSAVAPNSVLGTQMQTLATQNALLRQTLAAFTIAANAKLDALELASLTAQQVAAETTALTQSLESKMSTVTSKLKLD